MSLLNKWCRMPDIFRILWDRRDNWRHWVVLPIVVFFGWWFSGGLLDITTTYWSPPYPLMCRSLIIVSAITAWLLLRRPPRAKKGTIGLAVAVYASSEQEQRQLREDFVHAIRTSLATGRLAGKFSFVELPAYYSKRVRSHLDAAKLCNRCRVRLIVYGGAKVRMDQGRETHILELAIAVRHSRLSEEEQDKFGAEIVATWTPKIKFARKNEYVGFEICSRMVDLATKYILGLALFVSYDADGAETLFKSVQDSLTNLPGTIPGVVNIRNRIHLRLRDTYGIQARLAYLEWREDWPSAPLNRLKDYSEKVLEIDPKDPNAHVNLALWHFVTNRDLSAARKELQEVDAKVQPVVYCDLAFLSAYEGNLDEATELYKRAFQTGTPAETTFDVEHFIVKLLEREPDKVQLHYCIGLINAHGKNDYQRAISDLTQFVKVLGSELSPQFIRARASAQAKINWCRKQLGE